MNVLITGGEDKSGRELAELCAGGGDEVVRSIMRTLDVTDRDAVLTLISAARPEAIVHAASWTAVDACESDPDRAHAANAAGAAYVAEAAKEVGAHLVHISTDYVFDGTKPTPYDESDAPNPMSVYGRSKWAGEQAVAAAIDDATIVRISWVCGRYGNNMVKTLLRLAADGVDPKFVDDQIGHPTIVSDLVPVLRRFALERRGGLFHVTNQGAVSWFEFARATFEAAGRDPGRISPTTTAELQPRDPHPRPANSVLRTPRLRASDLPLLPDFMGSLDRLVGQLSV